MMQLCVVPCVVALLASLAYVIWHPTPSRVTSSVGGQPNRNSSADLLTDPMRKVPYTGMASVPLANMSWLEDQAKKTELAAVFKEAFATVGMLRLTDSGLSPELVDAMSRVCKQFFALPLHRKIEFGYGDEKDAVPLGGTYPQGRRYHVPASFYNAAGEREIVNEWILFRNVTWPSTWREELAGPRYTSLEGKLIFKAMSDADFTFPEELPDLERTLAEYHRAVQKLAERVMRTFALALGVDEYFFVERSKTVEWPITIANYPDTYGKSIPAGTMRINPHWDRGMFALVTRPWDEPYNEAKALQVLVDDDGQGVDARSPNAQWRAVPLQSNEFLINLGEVMARWSNGLFKHVVHQVPNAVPGTGDRLSFMAYVMADHDQVIDPILQAGATPRYGPVTAGVIESFDTQKGATVYPDQWCIREKLRLSQGMYTPTGRQGAVRFPSSSEFVHVDGCPAIL